MNRCDGPATDLDDPDAEPQTPAKTEVLFQTKSHWGQGVIYPVGTWWVHCGF